MKAIVTIAAAAALAAVGCASSAKVDPKALKAASEGVKSANLAAMECPELADQRTDLVEKTAGAVVRPGSVDLASPSGIAKAKDLSPGQTAASVAMTAAKSTVPFAGFLPLITGSAGREAKRTDAINDAKVTLAKLEGVMIVKGCPFDGGEEAPAEEASASEAATPAVADETATQAETSGE